MKLAIGSDHRGYTLKARIIETLDTIEWNDVGCFSPDSCDYPEYAKKVVTALRSGAASAGVLLCGTGVGMAIAANRFNGIYAALAWNAEIARLSKEHDNANVLVLPARYLIPDHACLMIREWSEAVFAGGRHQRRIEHIDTL